MLPRWPPLPHSDDAGWARMQKVGAFFTKLTATCGAAISPEKPVEMGNYPYPNFVAYASRKDEEIYPIAKAMIDGYDAYKTWITDQVEPGPHGRGSADHYANFVDCIRSRRAQDIHSPIEEAHISTTLVHLANASYRLGRTLKFDSAQEQVINDDEANRLLRGSYRAPYIVPEQT